MPGAGMMKLCDYDSLWYEIYNWYNDLFYCIEYTHV